MSVSIRFFGAAAYLIATASGRHVLIDPFLNQNVYSPVKAADLERVDLLLLTHNAFDHFGDAGDAWGAWGGRGVARPRRDP
jgi:L-ascorbate metabolism protein UlaG (beta-lactamase superfamily)